MKTLIDEDSSDFCLEMHTLLYFQTGDNEKEYDRTDDATLQKNAVKNSELKR